MNKSNLKKGLLQGREYRVYHGGEVRVLVCEMEGHHIASSVRSWKEMTLLLNLTHQFSFNWSSIPLDGAAHSQVFFFLLLETSNWHAREVYLLEPSKSSQFDKDE